MLELLKCFAPKREEGIALSFDGQLLDAQNNAPCRTNFDSQNRIVSFTLATFGVATGLHALGEG